MSKRKNTPLIKPRFVLAVDCPRVLYDAVLALGCSRINQEHIFRLIGILLNEMLEEGYDTNDFYKPMSKEYLNEVTSDNFRKLIWKQVSYCYKTDDNMVSERNSIFQTNGKFKRTGPLKKRPKHYRINPQLLKGDYVQVQYRRKDKNEEGHLNHLFPELIQHFNESYSLLGINIDLFNANIPEELSFSFYPVGKDYVLISRTVEESEDLEGIDSIPKFFEEEVKVINGKRLKNVSSTTIETKLKDVREALKDEVDDTEFEIRIIIDGNKVSIDKVDDYIKRRSSRAVNSALRKGDIISRKSGTPIITAKNGRFSTPITGLNRIGMKYLQMDGLSLWSYDLKSSQIVILANLMCGSTRLIKSLRKSKFPMLNKYLDCFLRIDKSSYDVKLFLDYLISDDIYIQIAKDLKITRDMAKPEMFRILFTEPGARLPKYKVRTMFSDFFEYLKEVKQAFKEEFGKSATPLSYFLQMVEAHIFLECILMSMAKKGIKGFSKHDSVLASSYNVDKVIAIVEEQKTKLGFRGVFKESVEDNVIDWVSNPVHYNDPMYNLLSSHPGYYKNMIENSYPNFDED